ncbi:hypothetical protein DFH11DRAFT_44414 [Phellopilus nigrolimitatus]|nr:hypothetical protein DFH11DRAFT_44414 [Phellopilus nigrolimitatus]
MFFSPFLPFIFFLSFPPHSLPSKNLGPSYLANRRTRTADFAGIFARVDGTPRHTYICHTYIYSLPFRFPSSIFPLIPTLILPVVCTTTRKSHRKSRKRRIFSIRASPDCLSVFSEPWALRNARSGQLTATAVALALAWQGPMTNGARNRRWR